MTTSRKIFNATVALPADSATSLATLMRNSSLHWGLEGDLTTLSMDSILGSEVGLTPEATSYIGSDSNVRGGALGGSTYKGVTVLAGQNYSLSDMGFGGLIDPNQIWLYNQSGTNVSVVFQAR